MLIPTTPIPNFIIIIKSLFSATNNIADIDILIKQKKHSRFYPRGSDAIASLSRKIGGKNPVVFVPAYFCNESLSPLRNSQARIVFYSTNMDFTPNWSHINELSKIHTPDMFILTHYFGEVNDIAGAATFVNSNNCILLHDCAHHSYIPTVISSSLGIVMLSPHKIFATSPLSIVTCDEDDTRYLPILRYCNFKKQDITWVTKRFIQKLFFNLLPCRLKAELPSLSSDYVAAELTEQKVSWLSLVFFSAILKNAHKDISARAANYRYMFERVLGAVDNDLIRIVSSQNLASPYLFVLYVDKLLHEKVYVYLRKKCIPVSTWPDLPPEVVAEPELFECAIHQAKTLLFFPIHQGVNKNHIDYMCNSLFEGIKEA